MMKLSIITINYNNAVGLRKTMESVFAQTYRDFEYIVVDGASTDGSVDVIKDFESSNSLNFTWSSEPDTGIYNAMNKGIEIASGLRVVNALNRSELVEDKNKGVNRSEHSADKNKGNEEGYVLMLNSGDYFVDEHVVERVLPELDGTDIVQGNNIEVQATGTYRNRGYGKSNIDMFDIVKGYFLHQASFCRKNLFERYGYFDESYKMCADTKFFMSCLGFHNASFRYVDIDITNYDVSGISAERTGPWAERHNEELKRIRKEVFSMRMYDFMLENDKKIRLYDYLHSHRWTWGSVMAVAHIAEWFHKKSDILKIERIN